VQICRQFGTAPELAAMSRQMGADLPPVQVGGQDQPVDPLPAVRIERVERWTAELALRVPFRSGATELPTRPVLLVRVQTEVGEGWGECAALPTPTYTEEWLGGASLAIEDHLAPRLLGAGRLAPEGVARVLSDVAGHHMAKAALETALLDATLRSEGRSLADWLEVGDDRVEVGAAVGLHDRVDDVAAEAAARLEEGYRHLKLKVTPGRGPGLVGAVREAVGDDAVLRVDANGTYGPDQIDELYELDELGLLLIEQPFAADAWLAHAEMAGDLRTPLCLDESVRSVADLDTGLALGALGVVNVKPGRVGGLFEAVRLHDRAEDTGLGAWVGGMLETGVGRAAAVALAALPGFTLPGDTSASDRYWDQDLTEPFVLEDGHLRVPTAPGIATPDVARLTHLG